jgi:hypothetical protein
LGAIFKTEVSLDEKLMGTLRLVPVVVCADALNPNVAPSTTEALLLGVRLTFPGKSGGPDLEPPPQPLMLNRKRMATANRKIAIEQLMRPDRTVHRDLPMHPSSLIKHCFGSASWNHPGRALE